MSVIFFAARRKVLSRAASVAFDSFVPVPVSNVFYLLLPVAPALSNPRNTNIIAYRGGVKVSNLTEAQPCPTTANF